MLTQNELKEFMEYDPETGVFTWTNILISPKSRIKPGSRAGCLHNVYGYRLIGFRGKLHRAARLAYLYMEGEFPEKGLEIDHINRIRDDDRWENLRLATPEENSRNQKIRTTNNSGHAGIGWHKATGKWMARIYHKKEAIFLGVFVDLNEAIAARKEAELKYWSNN